MENKSIEHSRQKSRHENLLEEEENIFHPSHYSHFGCPTLPIAFAGADILLSKLYIVYCVKTLRFSCSVMIENPRFIHLSLEEKR